MYIYLESGRYCRVYRIAIFDVHISRKWKVLQSVQDRNETLFYRLLQDNFLQMVNNLLFGSFFMNSVRFFKSWKSMSEIFFIFCTQLGY